MTSSENGDVPVIADVEALGRERGIDLPALHPKGLDPRTMVEYSLLAIADRNDPPSVFVRDGLVRTLRDERDRPFIDPLDDAAILNVLSNAVSFRRHVNGEDAPKSEPIAAPRDLPKMIRRRGEWPGIPPLEAIVESPVLRPDGTILDQPGYDPATRLLYDPAPELDITVTTAPTRLELDQARDLLLNDLLVDFPFAAEHDRANALALLLTPIVRPLVPLVPLALLDAPSPGTGKGLLVGLVSRITTGRAAEVRATPTDEAEWAKTIAALLDEGATFVMFDEAKTLVSSHLAQALTAETFLARRLGHSKTIKAPQRATWVAAGNNLEIRGDLIRRSYRIRLDPKVARPWTRTEFRHPDIEGWATTHRSQLLGGLLTLARSWWAAGRPVGPKVVLGSFQPWADLLAGILHHAGIDGFLTNQTALYDEQDHDAREWETVLTLAAAAGLGGRQFKTADLVSLIRHDVAGIQDALPEEIAAKVNTPGFSKALGRALRSRIDRRHGERGLHIVNAGQDGHVKTNLWRIASDIPQTGDADAGIAGRCGVSSAAHRDAPTRARTETNADKTPHLTANPATPQPPKPPTPAAPEAPTRTSVKEAGSGR